MILDYILIGSVVGLALTLRLTFIRDTLNRNVGEDIFNSVLAGMFFPITAIVVLVKIYKRISEWS